mgnify:CR=1 FL=1
MLNCPARDIAILENELSPQAVICGVSLTNTNCQSDMLNCPARYIDKLENQISPQAVICGESMPNTVCLSDMLDYPVGTSPHLEMNSANIGCNIWGELVERRFK